MPARSSRPSGAVTVPTWVARTSHCAQIDNTSSRLSGSTIASIRSWLSLVMTSNGSMSRLAARYDLHVEVHAGAAPRRRFAGRAGEAGTSEILDSDDQTGVEQREAGLDQPLLFERVTDLHARPLVGVVLGLAETGRRQHAHAADAVATRGAAQQHGQVADSGGLAEDQPIGGQHTEAQHVHQRVAGVGLVEDGLAADRRHTDRVAVARDAADDAFGDPATAGVVERAEPQRIHDRNRAAHPW